MKLGLALIFGFFAAGPCRLAAQGNPCATSVAAGGAPIYPPIAKAAHVQDTVVLLLTYSSEGKVIQAKVISGAPMLRAAAIHFADGLTVGEYTGIRECPFAITFRMVGTDHECGSGEPVMSTPAPSFLDPQHYVITAVKNCYNVQYSRAS